MKVKLTQNAGGNEKGTTIDVIQSVGERLIERGAAEEVKTRSRKSASSDDD